MTMLNRGTARPASRLLRLLAALTMAGGLVLGGLSAPALADDVTGPDASGVTTQDQPTAQDQATGGALQNRTSAQGVAAADADPGPGDDNGGGPLEDDDCPGLGNLDVEPGVPGCQQLPCALDPSQENCPQPPSDDCPEGQPDYNGDDPGCGEPPIEECPNGDFNGSDPGCGTPPGNGGGDTPNPPGNGGNGGNPGGHHGNPGHSSSPGSTTGSPEGTVPGSSQVGSVGTCDPSICSSTGVTSAAPAASTPAGSTPGAGRSTLGDTGAPTHSTELLLLGLGLLGGGFLLVRRPRAATAAAGAHRRYRD